MRPTPPRVAPRAGPGLPPARRDALQQFGTLALLSAAAITCEPPAPAAALSPAAAPGRPTAWLPMAQYSAPPADPDAPAYSDAFVLYLTRFLVTYDAASAAWFRDVRATLPPGWSDERTDGALAEELGGFGASVRHGLRDATGAKGAAKLLRNLYSAYTEPGVPPRLAQLFSLLPPSEQPTDLMRRVIGVYAKGGAGADDDGAAIDALAPPDGLLPVGVRPAWDDAAACFRLPPSVQSAMTTSALGAVGRSPPSREINLGGRVYGLFALSGGLGCAMTHLTVVPLDVVKTRLQTRPGVYSGFADAFDTIRKEEGTKMLFWGAGATAAGYLTYGLTVYPGYELFKRLFFELAGPQLVLDYRVPLVLLAGAVATIITCFCITPFEAVRIRMVECPEYAPSFVGAWGRFVREGGAASLYDGLIPLLVRQVLFGMIKFLVFDTAADAITAALPAAVAADGAAQLGVSLLSGAIAGSRRDRDANPPRSWELSAEIVAGVLASVVSQPADVVLSKVAQGEGSSKVVGKLPGRVNQLRLLRQAATSISTRYGPAGFFRGLPSRIAWSGAIIAGQFFLYDLFKQSLHIAAADLTQFYDALGATAAFGGSTF